MEGIPSQALWPGGRTIPSSMTAGTGRIFLHLFRQLRQYSRRICNLSFISWILFQQHKRHIYVTTTVTTTTIFHNSQSKITSNFNNTNNTFFRLQQLSSSTTPKTKQPPTSNRHLELLTMYIRHSKTFKINDIFSTCSISPCLFSISVYAAFYMN